VRTLVVDASIAVKWVVEEEGTAQALRLLKRSRLIAPELLLAECANILWKKIRRDELSNEEALLAARLLQSADLELASTRSLMEPATRIAIELDHPAYDCVYLALAAERDCPFVTADERLLGKLDEGRRRILRVTAMSLPEADALVLRAE
jgi:predicted nucleic acid-binding protein